MSLAYSDDDGWRPRWGWGSSRFAKLSGARTEKLELQAPVVSPPSTAAEPRWLTPVLRRIEELQTLAPNWDGRGSAAVSRDALEFARFVLARAMAPTTQPPDIIPLGQGGVQLEWASPSAEIEIEIAEPYDADIYYRDRRTNQEREWRADVDYSDLARILRSEFTR